MNDAETVTLKLAELLRHPEDLEKIPALKSEFTRKKAAIDGQLKIGLREQLEVTQAGMKSISDGQRAVNLIKEEMMKIDKLCAEAQNMIQDFPHINLVSQTHRNFGLVESMKENIESFPERLEEIERLLEEDDMNMENQPNLLAIHHGLSQLRNIRDDAMEQVKRADDSSLEGTLLDHFSRLDEAVERFEDEHIGAIMMNLINLVQSGNNGLVVRLALVVEEEEKNDRKVKALMDAQKEHGELASHLKSFASVPKGIRGYKEKLLQAIEANAKNQIYGSDEGDGSNQAFLEDPDKLEKGLRWFFNDLNTVKLGMVSLMPKRWKIFSTYVSIYHRLMHDWLIGLIDNPALNPTHMLAIIHWNSKYYSKMAKLGIPADSLSPQLIDNREVNMVLEYRQLIIKSVDEWMERMLTTDKQTFLTRVENALDTDDKGYFRTRTLGDMWRMLREQLLVAGSSDRQDVTEGVVDSMFRALRSRQIAWENLIDTEAKKYITQAGGEPQQEGLQPLQDWLVALANDQIACIDDNESVGQISYLTSFQSTYEPMVSAVYAPTAATELERLRDGYVDLGTHCISTFVNLIFSVDFRSVLPEIFTQSWYEKQRQGQMISTFEDYLNDYSDVLHHSMRDILVEELADELLVRYLSSIRNRGVKIRRSDIAAFESRVRDDVVAVFGFFEKFPDIYPSIKSKWGVVKSFVNLLTADKHLVVGVFEEFKNDYWDVQISWVEAVLRARDDWDRGLVAGVKTKAAEIGIGQRGPETIMSKEGSMTNIELHSYLPGENTEDHAKKTGDARGVLSGKTQEDLKMLRSEAWEKVWDHNPDLGDENP